jgi:hypothetical protein
MLGDLLRRPDEEGIVEMKGLAQKGDQTEERQQNKRLLRPT